MKFIHLSDLHLGIPLNEHRYPSKTAHTTRRLELEDAFFNVLKEDLKVDAILISGDTFDKDGIRSFYIDRFIKQAEKSLIPVIMIAGNHDDFILRPSMIHRFKSGSLTLLTKDHPSVTIGDTEIIGMSTLDFDLTAAKAYKEASKADHQIFLTHGDVLSKKDRYYLTDVKSLEALGFDYIGLGHIHKHQFLAPSIAYAGNLEPFDFSEKGIKGYILGDLDARSFSFIPHAKRAYHKVKLALTEDDDSDAIIQKVKENVPDDKALVRVVLTGEKALQSEPLDAIKERLDAVYFVVEVKDERRIKRDLEALKAKYPGSLIEVLIEEASDEDALALALEALMESEGAS